MIERDYEDTIQCMTWVDATKEIPDDSREVLAWVRGHGPEVSCMEYDDDMNPVWYEGMDVVWWAEIEEPWCSGKPHYRDFPGRRVGA
jgi:hypothetical protein